MQHRTKNAPPGVSIVRRTVCFGDIVGRIGQPAAARRRHDADRVLGRLRASIRSDAGLPAVCVRVSERGRARILSRHHNIPVTSLASSGHLAAVPGRVPDRLTRHGRRPQSTSTSRRRSSGRVADHGIAIRRIDVRGRTRAAAVEISAGRRQCRSHLDWTRPGTEQDDRRGQARTGMICDGREQLRGSRWLPSRSGSRIAELMARRRGRDRASGCRRRRRGCSGWLIRSTSHRSQAVRRRIETPDGAFFGRWCIGALSRRIDDGLGRDYSRGFVFDNPTPRAPAAAARLHGLIPMSVAFRRESDEEHKDPRFETALGGNMVTARGAGVDRGEVAELKAAVEKRIEEREVLKRELRYWQTRLSTARSPHRPRTRCREHRLTREKSGWAGRERTIDIVGHDGGRPRRRPHRLCRPARARADRRRSGESVDFNGKPRRSTCSRWRRPRLRLSYGHVPAPCP